MNNTSKYPYQKLTAIGKSVVLGTYDLALHRRCYFAARRWARRHGVKLLVGPEKNLLTIKRLA